MKKSEAVKYFNGAANLARLLDLTPHAVYQWPEKIPGRCQWQIAAASNFNLLPDNDLFPKGMSKEALKTGVIVTDQKVNNLLIAANELAQKGRGDVLDALTLMANHNL